MSIKLITDSASDLPLDHSDLVTVIPITVRFGQEEFKDGINLSHDEFYTKLEEKKEFPQTSQVTPFDYMEAIEKEKEAGADDIIIITLGSGLSGTYQNAVMAAQDFDNVYVVDSENVTICQMILVERAEQLIREGKSAKEIVDILNTEKKNLKLVALIDTLEYLKKGGRISPAMAAAGSLLNLKPIIGIEESKVYNYAKARGKKKGSHMMREKVKELGGIDYSKPFHFGYTGLDPAVGENFKNDSKELWNPDGSQPDVKSVGCTIGTHAGSGCYGIAFFANPKEE